MTPSWYDVLDVEPGASEAEIRAAWKRSIDDLDPADRRFKLRSSAAEVLLDPARRAEHDAELAAQAEPEEPDDQAEPEAPTGLAAADEPVRTTRTEPAAATRATTTRTEPATTPAARPRDRATDKATDRATDKGTVKGTVKGTSRSRVPLTAVAAVLAVLALVLATTTGVALARGADGDPLPDDADVAAARATAEAAVVPVLAYDYRDLAEGKAAAESFMTDSYRAEYDQYFAAAVEGNAERTQTVVEVEPISSGIVRIGPGQVDVLTFVNRPRTNAQGTVVYRDQVVLRMVDEGDEWLVDCLITTPGGSCES